MTTTWRTDRSAGEVRDLLLARAADDPRVTGAAVIGSLAAGSADAWSDVDLFLGVTGPLAEVVESWTTHLYDELGALHHFHLDRAPAVYRAWLLPGGVEVDLGFTPADSFGARGSGAFDVLFGTPVAPLPDWVADTDHLVGLAWHHVLHVRSALERGQAWRAAHWLAELRAHLLALAAVRLGLPSSYAAGADRLPASVQAAAAATLVASLDPAELARALAAAVQALVAELTLTDAAVATRLAPVLRAAGGLLEPRQPRGPRQPRQP